MTVEPIRGRVERAFRACRIFQGVDDEVVATLARHSVRRSYERGDNIWRAGDPAANMALIASGIVKVAQGRNGAILALFGPHETFGEMAVIEGGPYSAETTAATHQVELFCIDAMAIRSAIQTHPAFARAMERSLVAHARELEEKVRIMSAGCVERRLAALLTHLWDRFGDELEDGSHIVPVVLSRAELASLVGATIETTIRTMCRLQREGLVSTVREGFIVHAPARLSGFESVQEEGSTVG
jgi:CRP/FNR family transcriptional regulator